MPFLGRFEHAIDVKGRISVPAPFRDEMAGASAERLILAPYQSSEGPVLWAFPPAVWQRIVESRFEHKSPFDPALLRFKREVVQKAWAAPMDGAGRILVTAELRSFARLERDVILAGMNEWFEIWAKENYANVEGIDPDVWTKL